MQKRPTFSYSKKQTDQYLNDGGAPTLDGLYTVFGEISEGLDIVEKISNVPIDGRYRPTTDVRIIKAYVLEDTPAN